MKINNITITDSNLEEYYEFKEEEFLGRTETWCGMCNGKGHYVDIGHDKTKCDECNGTGELHGDGEHDHHECGNWDADDMDFDDTTHVSIDRTCPTCHQVSRLHFWRELN